VLVLAAACAGPASAFVAALGPGGARAGSLRSSAGPSPVRMGLDAATILSLSDEALGGCRLRAWRPREENGGLSTATFACG